VPGRGVCCVPARCSCCSCCCWCCCCCCFDWLLKGAPTGPGLLLLLPVPPPTPAAAALGEAAWFCKLFGGRAYNGAACSRATHHTNLVSITNNSMPSQWLTGKTQTAATLTAQPRPGL
jgi:hypothetical protein